MGSMPESTPALPQPNLKIVTSGVSVLNPLSRRGHGPGMIVLVHEDDLTRSADPTVITDGIPSVTLKWAEEGYVVAEVREQAWNESKDPLTSALNAIFTHEGCDQKEKVGLVSYSPALWNKVAPSLSSHPEIIGAVIYTDQGSTSSLASTSLPTLHHIAGPPSKAAPTTTLQQQTYTYASASTFSFATPLTHGYHYASESVSHTRNLTFFKSLMSGPYFNLEAIWDEHTAYEFESRDVPATMSTMVQEPYVNHIPTLTGGIGRTRLSAFYAHHFVFQNPDDTELELISRTVGIDRVIDEFIFKFTHDRAIDWLLPGVPPTFKKVEIPFTAVVNVRGDRLYHEHIAWDQASVLRQIGLLPEYLPWPAEYKIEGREGGQKNLEYRLPVAGRETGLKMRDKNSVESNLMFEYGVREVQ